MGIAMAILIPLSVGAHDVAEANLSAEVEASTTVQKGLKPSIPAARLENLRDKAQNAQERKESIKDNIQNRVDNIKNKIETNKERMASSSEARKDDRDAQVKVRFTQFISQVKHRMEAAVERFNKIVERIDSRIAKLDAAGADTTEAKTLLADAKLKLETAGNSTALISTELTATTTLGLRPEYEAVKTQFEKAKSDLKAAQDTLIKVVRSLGGIKVEVHATTSASVNN